MRSIFSHCKVVELNIQYKGACNKTGLSHSAFLERLSRSVPPCFSDLMVPDTL